MKKFIASIICIAMFAGMAMAQSRGNIGFGFGTSFHAHQKAVIKQAAVNYFRLYLKAEEGVHYFLHKESGNFMIDEGDADANATKNAEAIGMSIDLGILNLDVLVGSATVKVDGKDELAAKTVKAANTTDPFAEIAVRYSYVKSSASLDLNFAYRYHTLSKDIEYQGTGDAEDLNDLSSINLSVGISYLF